MPTFSQAPQIPTFNAGYAPFVSDFGTDITGPFSALCYAPLARVELTTGQSISATTFTVLQYASILEDAYSGWSTVATSFQPAFSFLAPAGWSGWYEVTLNNRIAGSAATDEVECGLFGGSSGGSSALVQELAGLPSPASASLPGGSSGQGWIYLNGGTDYVQGAIWCGLASTANSTVGQRCDLEICWFSS